MAEKGNLLDLLRKALEIAMPDLRHYYRVVRKAKVEATYASDGRYYADVQPLRNDGTVDDAEPVVPKVEIPVLWAGPQRGVVCPPVVGTLCDLSYYDGDPQYPTITNFRHAGGDAPAAELNEFVIQLEPGVEIRIDQKKQVVTLTPENVDTRAGKSWIINCGNDARIVAGKNALVEAGEQLTYRAPKILREGNETATGTGGEIGTSFERAHRQHEGSYTLSGPAAITGDVVITGNLRVSGNSSAGSRSGGGI